MIHFFRTTVGGCGLLLLLLFLNTALTAQRQSQTLAAVNLPPVFRPVYEAGLEQALGPAFGCDVYVGWMEKDRNSIFMRNFPMFIERKGFFVKSGIRLTPRSESNQTAFLLAGNIVTSFLHEVGNTAQINPFFPIVSEPEVSTETRRSINLGASAIMGMTFGQKYVHCDLGLQFGTMLRNGMLHQNGYVPGLGNRLGTNFYLQGVLRLKVCFATGT